MAHSVDNTFRIFETLFLYATVGASVVLTLLLAGVPSLILGR